MLYLWAPGAFRQRDLHPGTVTREEKARRQRFTLDHVGHQDASLPTTENRRKMGKEKEKGRKPRVEDEGTKQQVGTLSSEPQA